MDIVIVDTPDHWHALPTIAAIEAGADVFVQKPISVDVAEGHAMLTAARKHNRVAQVGMQRRSTPHLIEARDRVIREGGPTQARRKDGENDEWIVEDTRNVLGIGKQQRRS